MELDTDCSEDKPLGKSCHGFIVVLCEQPNTRRGQIKFACICIVTAVYSQENILTGN